MSTKEDFLKLSNSVKECTFNGLTFSIRKLKTGEMRKHGKDGEDGVMKLMQLALVDPVFSEEEFAELPFELTDFMAKEFMVFNKLNSGVSEGNSPATL